MKLEIIFILLPRIKDRDVSRRTGSAENSAGAAVPLEIYTEGHLPLKCYNPKNTFSEDVRKVCFTSLPITGSWF
jgi:hypothetical protein